MNRFLLTLGLLVAAITQAQAHSAGEHAGHAMPAAPASAQATPVRFADVALTDQDGRTVSLERDLVSDRIVVMSFIYTSCTTVCPVVSSILGKVQTQLGERVGREVQLVSLSIDPQRDDARRLNDYARTFQNGPGWSWLTGSPGAVTETLKGLGSFNSDLGSHAPLILVGDGNSRNWTRYYGFTDPAVLVREVERLGAQRHAHAGHRVVTLEQQP